MTRFVRANTVNTSIRLYDVTYNQSECLTILNIEQARVLRTDLDVAIASVEELEASRLDRDVKDALERLKKAQEYYDRLMDKQKKKNAAEEQLPPRVDNY